MQKKFIKLNSATMTNCCVFFMVPLKKSGQTMWNVRKPKKSLNKNQFLFNLSSKIKGKNSTWSLHNRGIVTLYTSQLLKKKHLSNADPHTDGTWLLAFF